MYVLYVLKCYIQSVADPGGHGPPGPNFSPFAYENMYQT